MKIKLALVALVLGITTSLNAQEQTLAEMMSDAGVDWILGEWVDTSDDALEEVTISLSLTAAGNAMRHEARSASYQWTALSFPRMPRPRDSRAA